MTPDDDVARRAGHIRRWIAGDQVPPLALTIGPTEACNLRCRFCALRQETPVGHQRKRQKELSDMELLGLVDDAAQLGVEVVNVSGGGEPFVRKATLNLMRAIKQKGMDGAMTTNGTLLTRKAVGEIVKMGWNRIDFSIDGPDARTHDFLRDCPGSFERVTAAVSHFSRLKRKLATSQPKIWIYTVLTNENHTKIDKMIRLVHELGARDFMLIPVTVHHPEGKALRLREEHWKQFQTNLRKAEALAERYDVSTNLGDFTDPSLVLESNNMTEKLVEPRENCFTDKVNEQSGEEYTRIPCYEPWLTLVVHPDGHLDPCEMMNNISALGSRSLAEVWFDDKKLNKMRQEFLKGKLLKSCAKCCGPLVVRNIQMRALLGDE